MSAPLTIAVLMAAAAVAAFAEEPTLSDTRPVHTYSIVARDPETGRFGVAVQSHWFGVGSVVPWAKAGVGAVATQSFVDPSYGPRGLERMERGDTAQEALDALLAEDDEREVRQIAFVDREGRVAAFTGSKCIESAGHHTGDGYGVQANLMRNDRIVPAMAEAYESAEGDFADRLLAALRAAEAAGGDIRGSQSAAILIVAAEGSETPWADRIVDLRVEDDPDPIAELGRLVELHRAYDHMNRGDVAVEEGDIDRAMSEYGAAARLAPENLEMLYWSGVTLATNGRIDDALPLFRKVFAADPGWIELTGRLQEPGLIPDGPEGDAIVARILEVSP